MNSFNIRRLSNSNMGELKFKSHMDELSNSNIAELELSIMHSQIQHGWTQVQIPHGWTLKFKHG
jgi:hypothetical protein